MNEIQQLFLILFAAVCAITFAVSLFQVQKKKNIFGLTQPLLFIGSFVWGDAVIFSLFWFFVCLLILWANNWYLFLLFLSVFWTVRGLGETIYWLNQQFSAHNRNPPETLLGYRLFPNDSLWFVYQIFWQCVTVVGVIASIYYGWFWIQSIA